MKRGKKGVTLETPGERVTGKEEKKLNLGKQRKNRKQYINVLVSVTKKKVKSSCNITAITTLNLSP